MDPAVRAVLGVCMRWIHIASVVTLIGGFIYARFVLAPALASVPPTEGYRLANLIAVGFRPLLFTVLVTTLLSGIYNFATKASYPPTYQLWFGIKMLLVLHIFAAAVLYSLRPSNLAKRNRTAFGIVISGLIIIAISNYLRYLSLQ
jgi:hypothetical protein